MAQSIWGASAVTPAATDRIPVDVSSSGAPSRWTGQDVANAASRIGVTLNALGSINSNTTIDLANGAYVTATIAGALTFTFSNPPASGQGMQFVLVLTNGGSAVVTWPGSVTWTGGTAPTLRSSGVDVLRFYTSNAGTNWYGELAYDEQSIDASAITSGTLAHERGGLEADVSAYSGLVKITGGTTSAVTVTAAGEALLDDATAADQRTTLGLGTAATAATGDFAAASHTHAASDITSGTLDAARLPASTTSAAGAIEIATVAEVEAGTDTARAVTPQGYRTATPPYVEWGASTDRTLALTDANVDQWCNNGSTARVLNVPTNASVAFATGTKIPILRLGSGTCTIDAATGVTLNGVSGGSCTISTQYQGALLTKTGTDSWVISGDVSAVA